MHAEILAEKDQAKAAELRRHAMSADYFLSSVSGLSETGELVSTANVFNAARLLIYFAGDC